MHFAVESHILDVDLMPLLQAQFTIDSNPLQVIRQSNGTAVEQDMVVGTEAQEIARGIISQMRFAQRPNVGSLLIEAAWMWVMRLLDVPQSSSGIDCTRGF